LTYQDYNKLRGELIESDHQLQIPTIKEIQDVYGKWNVFMKEMGLPTRKKIIEILTSVRDSLLNDLADASKNKSS